MHRLLAAFVLLPAVVAAAEPFRLTVLDSATGRGVPLVEVETVHGVSFVTDSAGVVAVDAPELFGRKVWFGLKSHGYERKADGFGYRGLAVDVTPGGRAKVEIDRVNLAERLYRVTGGGIYAESVKLGDAAPIERPLLNAGVFGQDSVQTTIYRGKVFWNWGDTNLPGYPLGIFDMTGATSELPGKGGLDPAAGVNLRYFAKADGIARPLADMPGDGPTWLGGPFVLGEGENERLFAGYAKIKPPLSAYRQGLCRWDADTGRYEHVVDFPEDAAPLPVGHAAVRGDGADRYVYFGNPVPLARVPAHETAIADARRYEGYSCLTPGGRMSDPQIDRGPDGKIRYGWKANTAATGPAELRKLVERKLLRPEESLIQLRDRDTGRPILAHAGTVERNEFRQRWVMIAVEAGGESSLLGEVWYAEAETPLGPWAYAVKVATHDDYDFYNPKHHVYFDADGGRRIFFEGTFVRTFSKSKVRTPRYDYNQVMYRLDLEDPRAALPVAIGNVVDGTPPFGRMAGPTFDDWRTIPFFACDRPGLGTVPIGVGDDLSLGVSVRHPLFHAIPADAAEPPQTTVPLREFVNAATGDRRYSTDETPPTGYEPGGTVCRVWRNPFAAR